jgi:F-box-like
MTLEHAQGCDQAPMSPIHGLPDEILEVIFLINTSKLVGQGNKNHPYDPHLTTLATAQVCQRWRAVALDYPVIWSRIINYERHSPLWIEKLLARSGSASIDVGGDSAFEAVKLQHPRGKPVLQSIFQRISSLKTVSLHIRRAPWESICRSFLGHPAPNLEFLNLITSCPFPDCLYPNPLFADEAPRLRRLHLERCLIDFSSCVLSNLTELSVANVAPIAVMSASAHSHQVKVPPSVAGWLRVLKNIPALRFLTLSSAISHFTDDEPLPVVDLPHLALLTISTRFRSGVSLINHLNIPPLCGIRFRLYRNHIFNGGLDGPGLLSFLSKQLTHWPQDFSDRYLQAKILSGDRIHFGNSKRVGLALDMTESDEVEAHSRYSKDPMLSLVITFDPLENSFAFFNQLLELYSSTFSTTTSLDLWVDQEFADTAITVGSFSAFPTFHSFTNVKALNLLEQSPLYLIPLFQPSSLPDHPLFPALQTLYLTGTNMDDVQGDLCSVFVAFLLRRAEARIPLPEIRIIAGRISNQTAEDLSRLGNLRVSLESMPLLYVNAIMGPYAEDET